MPSQLNRKTFFFCLLLFLLNLIYDFISMSFSTYFENGVLVLPLSDLPSNFSSIIVIFLLLFPIKCSIYISLLVLTVFHVDFFVFIVLKTSLFLTLSVHKILSVILQHYNFKVLFWPSQLSL